jgi:DNA-binding winged helix-turn-helix (wHTH) protein/dipeptidyl aminopeptidase/acylaminoacyl peptidase
MEGSTAEHNVGSRKRFGVFEFDPQARELTKHGVRLKVQEQPIQILAALLEQAGQIVPREELQRRLWPDGTFVDYEQSLNKAVNKLREALGDSADHPIYIETLARRGYRFVAPVEGDRTVKPVAKTAAPRRRVAPWLAAGGCVLAIVLATGLWPIDVPQVERVVPLTNDTTLKGAIGRLISDGNRVLYCDGSNVWSVPASGGEPRRLSLPFLQGGDVVLIDYSPIRQQILLGSPYTGRSGATEFWLAGTEGEAAHKVAEIEPPSTSSLAPDAERIAFSAPDGIYVQSIKSGARKRVHTMTAMSPTLPWWHPSGHSVGFLDPPDDPLKARAWQVNDDGSHPRRIVPETEYGQGSGAWSQDGKRFFYSGGEGEVFVRVQAGILGWLRKPFVTRLTASGQFRGTSAPAVDPVNPRRLYAIGSVLRGETMRYDRKARRWVSFLGEFFGEKIDRSPDGQWLAYVTFPGAELHRCRTDGSSDVLLAAGVEAMNPSWSPNGRQIAFSGRAAGTSVKFKLWLVSPGGGDAAPYPPGIESGYDTIWSGDGNRILLGQDFSAQNRIRVLHLKTGELESVAGTERLFSPRWSPDEKQILALDLRCAGVFILDIAKDKWRPLTEESIGYPKWSRDGKYIYGETASGSVSKAIRIAVATGHLEEIARVDFKRIENGSDWLGWTEDWEPLTVRDLSSTQVYRIDLDR